MKLTALIFSLILTRASAADPTIFDVRRNLPLNDQDKVYHDYLVDGGSEAGLKAGMTAVVTRRAPLYDYYRFRSVGDLQLQVAKVRVVAVQDGLSVVRLQEEISRESASVLEDNALMIGDTLDLATLATPVPIAPAPTPAAAAPKSEAKATILVNSVDVSNDSAASDDTNDQDAPAQGAAKAATK